MITEGDWLDVRTSNNYNFMIPCSEGVVPNNGMRLSISLEFAVFVLFGVARYTDSRGSHGSPKPSL